MVLMISIASRVCCSSSFHFFSLTIAALKSCEPIPTQCTPDLNHAERFFSLGSTPPVGISLICGTTGLTADTNPGPSTDPGKSLISGAPLSCAVTISVNVPHPGIQLTPRSAHTTLIDCLRIGDTIKWAPASMYFSVSVSFMMVPIPSTRSEEHTSELQSQ